MTDTATPARFEITLGDEAATVRLAEDLAAAARCGQAVELIGDLGAGKTTLARGFIRALALNPELAVPSPTFTLIESYETVRGAVSHADLYRLGDASEVAELGLDEAAESGILLVEWPERGKGYSPEPDIRVTLTGDAPRTAAVEALTPQAAAALRRSLAIRAFLNGSKWVNAARQPLSGDASHRVYETLTLGSGASSRTAILMDAPRDDPGPPVRDGKPYSEIAHIALEMGPFVAIDEILRAEGFCAPEIYACDLDSGLLLIEPLGTDTMLEGGVPVAERYIAAAELLAEMHTRSWPASVDYAPGRRHDVPPFDRTVVEIEVELLTDWYLPHVAGRPATPESLSEFRAIWQELGSEVEADRSTLVLRDFHSPNLIWRGDRDGTDRLGLIDFQDALIGPPAYDLASLGQDARVTVPPELEKALLAAYAARRRQLEPGFDEDHLLRLYAILAAQRATKVAGIFARLNYRDGKAAYLAHLPRIRDYLRRTLEHPVLAALKDWYRRHVFFD